MGMTRFEKRSLSEAVPQQSDLSAKRSRSPFSPLQPTSPDKNAQSEYY